jgi:hypothetical protein
MQDQPKAEAGPLLGRDHSADLGLDLDRILDPDQTQPVAEPDHVGVDREPRFAEGHPQDDVGGLAAHPGQAGEALHGVRHLAPELLTEHLAHADQGASLGPKESGGVDQLLELALIGMGVAGCAGHAGE